MRAGRRERDAVVVGAGPNGLAAAVVLARAGLQVLLVEAGATIGGGTRSAELTVPGFVHDVCSAIHPTALASPLFGHLPLAQHGLAWVHPQAPLAHPFDDGGAALLERSIDATGDTLDRGDAVAWRSLMAPLVATAPALHEALLGPLRLPRHPLALARFGMLALRSARGLAAARFAGGRARALFAGLAAHSFLPLERAGTSAFGLVLGLEAHALGWPCARGGSQSIADALGGYFLSLGGEIETGRRVEHLADLPAARAVIFDLTPVQLLHVAGDQLPARYARRLARYRYGPGAFKMDWALDGPIPWRSAECARAATVHVGGSIEEIAASEAAPWQGRHAEKPFVLVAQQSLFDATRAPAGNHTAWAYCHVPARSTVDMSQRIEAQIERFAPGFRDRVLARHVMGPAALEQYNQNYIGGDIVGGANDLDQVLARPIAALVPYATPNPRLYLCSSSTPPGGDVHGMCGARAAYAVLTRSFGRRSDAAFESDPGTESSPTGERSSLTPPARSSTSTESN